MKKKVVLIAAVILVSLGLLSVSKIVQNKYLSKNGVLTDQKAKDIASKEVNITKETNVKVDDKNNETKQGSEKDTIKDEVKPESQGQTAKTNPESKIATEQKNTVESKIEVKPTETKAQSTEKLGSTKGDITKTPEPKKEPNLIIKDDISGKIILSINISTENKTVGELTMSELDNKGIAYKTTGRGDTIYFTMINNLKARDSGPLSGWCFYVNGSKASISCGAFKLKAGDVVEWKYLKDGVNN